MAAAKAIAKPTGGYCGKMLRVDLTKRQIATTDLPEPAVLRQFVGGIGLGRWFLSQEMRPDMAPTDADAPLLFMTGPLTGTSAPSSSNLAVVRLNHNTPSAVAAGHSPR